MGCKALVSLLSSGLALCASLCKQLQDHMILSISIYQMYGIKLPINPSLRCTINSVCLSAGTYIYRAFSACEQNYVMQSLAHTAAILVHK